MHSYDEYLRFYGSVFAPGKYMPYAVKGFFDNGGRRAYVVRIVGANARTATATIGAYTIRAVGPGTAGNRIWIRIGPSTAKQGGDADPRTGSRTKVPPGGHICGIYARSDTTRGVRKAPANEAVAAALDLEFDVDRATQGLLTPRGVNVIRRFPGRGIRVWRARTLSSDPLWKYVSVRRLLMFLEASIDRGTQWVVFEPNDEDLWARVRETVAAFLRAQWRDGALLGAKEEEAFFVAVGRETMTADDILNGRLIVEVGIAPVRPAEFVVFRILQKTQAA